ncbi:hypothetical protein KFK14_12730 [Sphingobium phenoxybenzoativorans]|uniref:Uncharacterized protein n=1 Tax=Sphingobium phenoxybenzoativorans TaxID=1592790 RepID=A0A975K346_9SPHN|nr:hypothetical protein [Sphingobium phenoxybenzoativorans]QUT04011.1 hypothetical protein KFK14_12730 [Sphingobium phenoxybenzoativorans]
MIYILAAAITLVSSVFGGVMCLREYMLAGDDLADALEFPRMTISITAVIIGSAFLTSVAVLFGSAGL